MARQLRLLNVVSPGNNDEILVTRTDPLGPPGDQNLPAGSEILPGDTLHSVADSSAEVAYWDTGTNEVDATVTSFEGAEPTTVEVNWAEVSQVDEFYNNGPYQYDITTNDDPGLTYTISG